jgi:hypothetical protein
LGFETIKNFSQGRREVIQALERAVWEKELFEDSARLLLSLAEAENESWSNNATGVFVQLFSHVPGHMATTKTPPKDRLIVLKDALCEKSDGRRKIGLKASDIALQTRKFIRLSGLDSNELDLDKKGWTPATEQELLESYKAIIELLIAKMTEFPADDQREAIKILSSRSRDVITSFPSLAEFVIDKVEEASKLPSSDEEKILHDVISIQEYEKGKLDPEILDRLRQLEIRLTGEDYVSLMRRYVAMDRNVDFARENSEKIRQEKVRQLAQESFDLARLTPELKWLVTTKAKDGYFFGHELGVADNEQALLPLLLDAQRSAGQNRSVFFLSGYLAAVYEKNKTKWEELIHEISRDIMLSQHLIELSWRSGITDTIGSLILDLAREGKVSPKEFSVFRYGGVIERLSEDIVKQWIHFLLKTNDQTAISIATELFYFYYIHRQSRPLDRDLTFSILSNQSILNAQEAGSAISGDTWAEIAKSFLKQYNDLGIELAEVILQNFNRQSFFAFEERDILPVLDIIASNDPSSMWRTVVKYIGPPLDDRAYLILNWIRDGYLEGKGARFVDLVPFNEISEWVDEDRENRAPHLARFVPPILEEITVVRQILIRYGEIKEVQRQLIANFNSGAFSGSKAKHFEKKKQELLDRKEAETDAKVKKWIDIYVQVLEEDIDRSKAMEEREF